MPKHMPEELYNEVNRYFVPELKDIEPMVPRVQIPKSILKLIRNVYRKNPMRAGELAISIIEMYFCGTYTSDDKHIADYMISYEEEAEGKIRSYEEKIENTRQEYIIDKQLDLIAEGLLEGLTQKEIGKKLNIPQGTVSKRIKKIREEYPELLGAMPPKAGNPPAVTGSREITDIGKDDEKLGDFGEDGNGPYRSKKRNPKYS